MKTILLGMALLPLAGPALAEVRPAPAADVSGPSSDLARAGNALIKGDAAAAAILRRKASDAGDTGARYLYARMLWHGYGVKRDRDKATALLDDAAAKGNPDAGYMLALILIRRGNSTEDRARARKLLTPLAEAGSDDARVTLARQLLDGGSAADRNEALRLLEAAAKNNSGKALRELARAEVKKTGATETRLRKASALGDTTAALTLAEILFAAETPEGRNEGMEYLRAAAAAGSSAAGYRLGELAYEGEIIPQSYEEAYAGYARAAINGHAPAVENRDALAAMFSAKGAPLPAAVRGGDVPDDTPGDPLEDYDETGEKLRLGMEQGQPAAAFRLGLIRVAAGDAAGALKCFAIAADKGDAAAMLQIARLRFESGRESWSEGREQVDRACKTGDATALYVAGCLAFKRLYGFGGGSAAGIEKVTRAARLGYTPAFAPLARMLREGDGSDKTLREACVWMTAAEDGGDVGMRYSMYKLLVHRALIIGAPPPSVLLRECAQSGYPKAMADMGTAYRMGEENQRPDNVAAYAWYSAAAICGDPDGVSGAAQIKQYNFSENPAKDPLKISGPAALRAADQLAEKLLATWQLRRPGKSSPVAKDDIAAKIIKKTPGYDTGDSVEIIAKAMGALRRSIIQNGGTVRAAPAEDFAEGMAAIRKPENPAAAREGVRLVRQAADAGHPAAQRAVADMFMKGDVYPADTVEAAIWYSRAADAGDKIAAYKTGRLQLEGSSVPLDAAEGVRRLTSASKLGVDAASLLLAEAFRSGKGVKKNPGEALRLYRLLAEKSPESLYRLGEAYEQGLGVPVDRAEALRHYRLADSRTPPPGNAEARRAIARLAAPSPEKQAPDADPVFVPKKRGPAETAARAREAGDRLRSFVARADRNDEPAVRFAAALVDWSEKHYENGFENLRHAAYAGHPLAQEAYGIVCSHGYVGSRIDFTGSQNETLFPDKSFRTREGLDFLRAAANRGQPAAQARLGALCAEGDGIPRNDAEAARLLSAAIAAGDITELGTFALMHLESRGGLSDPVRGLELLRAAAGNGDERAMLRLGRACAAGEWRLPKDPEAAEKWLAAAADSGSATAIRERAEAFLIRHREKIAEDPEGKNGYAAAGRYGHECDAPSLLGKLEASVRVAGDRAALPLLAALTEEIASGKYDPRRRFYPYRAYVLYLAAERLSPGSATEDIRRCEAAIGKEYASRPTTPSRPPQAAVTGNRPGPGPRRVPAMEIDWRQNAEREAVNLLKSFDYRAIGSDEPANASWLNGVVEEVMGNDSFFNDGSAAKDE